MKNDYSIECAFWRKHNIGNDDHVVYLTDLKVKGWKAWELDSTIVFLQDPSGDLSYWDHSNSDTRGLLVATTRRYKGGHFRLLPITNQKDLRETFDLFAIRYKTVVEIT